MSWVPYTVRNAAKVTGTGVSASLRKLKGRAEANLQLNIAATVAKDLGWADGDKIEVQVGQGPLHGKLRIRKNNSAAGSALLKTRSGARNSTFFTIALGNVPNLVARSEAKRWCHWERQADGGWVEIVLPSWAKETTPAVPRASEAATEKPASVARPKRDVTAGLMGDPPAARSALAERA